MSKLFNCVKFSCVKRGSLILAIMFLTVFSVKADVITLGNPEGSYEHSFATPGGWVVGNRYTYSETFSLADENRFFTSFTLNPENLSKSVLSTIANGHHSKPEINLNKEGGYTGTAKWSGQVVVKTSDNNILFNTGVRDFSQTIGGITYSNPENPDNPTLIAGGTSGYAMSDWFPVNFSDLQTLDVSIGADELFGIQSLSFDFIISNISFDNTDFDNFANAGNAENWEGSIAGLVSMTYETASSSSTPEPATLLIFGLGTAGVGLAASRKRRGMK